MRNSDFYLFIYFFFLLIRCLWAYLWKISLKVRVLLAPQTSARWYVHIVFDWRHPDVLRFNIKMIKPLTSNTSYFIVCEATCFGPYVTIIRPSYLTISIARAEHDGTRAETRFRLSPKLTSPSKLVGASVQSTASSRSVRISGSNVGYTTFGGGVRLLATHSISQFPLHFPSRASPCATRFQLDSTPCVSVSARANFLETKAINYLLNL